MNNVHPAPIWRTELIDIDGITTPVWGEYADNFRWNGWLCPVMDAWSVVSVLDELAKIASVSRIDGDYAPRYDWDGDTLVLTEPAYEDEHDYVPDRIEPNEDGLYPLGSHAWVWSKSVEHTHRHGWDWTLGSHMCFDCDTVVEYCRENDD